MTHKPPEFNETTQDQIVHEIASPLIAVRNGREEFVSGTAFIIGPNFAITAYHVLADFVEKYEGVRDVKSHLNVSFEILFFLTINHGKNTFPMKVMRMWQSPPLDLAVLALGIPHEWPDDHRWKVPMLKLLPPKVGTSIAAFGFANSEVLPPIEQPHPTIHLHPNTATGVVEEIHHQARDSVHSPFPCFRTNARFDGGMSGGPVFDDAGQVCGVICSSIPPSYVGEAHVSYASTLWPIIGTMIDATDQNVASGDYYPLINLFQSGVLHASDLAHVQLAFSANGLRTPIAKYDTNIWDCSSAV